MKKKFFNKDKENEVVDIEEILKEEAITSPSKQITKRFFSNKLGVIGLVGFLTIVAIVFIGSAVMDFDPFYQQGVMKNIGPGSGYMNVPSQMQQEGIKDISVGTNFSVGLSKENNFYVWGFNKELTKQIPQEALDQQGNIKAVAAGDAHIIIATNDNQIIGWGSNAHDQADYPEEYEDLIKEEGIAQLGGGDLYSLLLTEEGTLRAWGATLPNGLNRIPKSMDQQIAEFEAGAVNLLVRKKDGTITVLGQKGTELDTSMPENLKDGSLNIVEIARMRYSGLAIDDQGEVHLWGAANDRINNIPEIEGNITKAISGREHITVLTDTNKVYSWGKDNYSSIQYPSEGQDYVDLFGGYFNNYAVKSDDSIETWGLNGFTMGSDEQGRDVFQRLVNGGQMTLIIAFVAVAIQVVIGLIVGVVAGYYGGRVDNFLMRFAEIVSSFPFYPLIITLSVFLPVNASQYQRLGLIMVILGLIGWTGIARLVRGEILSESQKDYITAAKALGLKESKIMMSHIVPNIISIIIVQATLGYASNLLTEAGLSFLGFGVKVPYPSWGNMLSAASQVSVIEFYWWRWVFPGLAVFLTALTVNLIGDALRDAMDPKSVER